VALAVKYIDETDPAHLFSWSAEATTPREALLSKDTHMAIKETMPVYNHTDTRALIAMLKSDAVVEV